MRVQTTVKLQRVGTATCDNCGMWVDCIEPIMNEKSFGRFCLKCIHSAEIVLNQDVSLPYTKKERKRTQKKAKKSEVKTAKETGGRCTGYIPSSGDSRNSKFFFEDKTRVGGDRKSYRLTQDVIVKGRAQAARSGLTPVFRVHLKDVSIGIMLWDDLVELVREGDE